MNDLKPELRHFMQTTWAMPWECGSQPSVFVLNQDTFARYVLLQSGAVSLRDVVEICEGGGLPLDSSSPEGPLARHIRASKPVALVVMSCGRVVEPGGAQDHQRYVTLHEGASKRSWIWLQSETEPRHISDFEGDEVEFILSLLT